MMVTDYYAEILHDASNSNAARVDPRAIYRPANSPLQTSQPQGEPSGEARAAPPPPGGTAAGAYGSAVQTGDVAGGADPAADPAGCSAQAHIRRAPRHVLQPAALRSELARCVSR